MIISVIGAGTCTKEVSSVAEEVGKRIAENGATLVTGGLGGVMEAASKGAKEAGGLTVGILPGSDRGELNPYVDIPVVTGLSHARNIIVVRTGDAVIAIAGEYGTLSEMAFALKSGKPVISISAWKVGEEIISMDDPQEAAEKAMELAKAAIE